MYLNRCEVNYTLFYSLSVEFRRPFRTGRKVEECIVERTRSECLSKAVYIEVGDPR